MSRALCSLSFMYAARALFARAKRCSLSYTYVISSEMQRCSTQRSLINTHMLSIGLHIRPSRMFQGDRQMLGVSISLRLHYSDLTPDKTSILGGGAVAVAVLCCGCAVLCCRCALLWLCCAALLSCGCGCCVVLWAGCTVLWLCSTVFYSFFSRKVIARRTH